MGSLVGELQRDALDKGVRVSDLLRKAFVVARKLKLAEFEAWIERELNGYGDVELPDYRKVRGTCRVFNPYNGRLMPVQFDDVATEVLYSYRHLGATISELEAMMAKPRQRYFVSYSSTATKSLMRGMRGVTGMHLPLPNASLMITHEEIVGIVDAVRTAVLKWSLKLEEDDIVGEGMSFSAAEKQAAAVTHYNLNYFFGPMSGQVQQGAVNSTQTQKSKGVDPKQLKALLRAIRSAQPQLALAAGQDKELDVGLATIEAQTRSKKPNAVVLRESLRSVKTILEGAGGALIASGIIQKFPQLFGP